MRMRSIIMLGLAAILGLGAVTLARGWIAGKISDREAVQVVEPARPQIALTKVVVARTALRFGNRITEQHVKEVEWPASAVPPGAFTSLEEFLTEEERVVLQAMQENEPVLAGKVTGGGERASLSAIIEPGMRAVTIRVNDVLGVAGFVLPGDRVDILGITVFTKIDPLTGEERPDLLAGLVAQDVGDRVLDPVGTEDGVAGLEFGCGRAASTSHHVERSVGEGGGPGVWQWLPWFQRTARPSFVS